MAKEKEFITKRFNIVKASLQTPTTGLNRKDRAQLRREYRLLGKILDEVVEGQVLRTLESWRGYLGQELARHKAAHRAEQETYDNWWRLPYRQRRTIPKPRPPAPGVEVTDKQGYVWVVDDRYLAMMDDLTARLHRWLATG